MLLVAKAFYLNWFKNLSSSSIIHWESLILTSTDNEPVINGQA